VVGGGKRQVTAHQKDLFIWHSKCGYDQTKRASSGSWVQTSDINKQGGLVGFERFDPKMKKEDDERGKEDETGRTKRSQLRIFGLRTLPVTDLVLGHPGIYSNLLELQHTIMHFTTL
jgi:hypothetical protein